MKNIKLIPILFVAVLTSFFYFPFEFSFLPEVNTKMAMAGLGLVLFILRIALYGKGELRKDMFIATILALSVSFASLAAMIYNGTSDAAYLTYIVSMLVWLSAAYFVVSVMRRVHGCVSVEIVCYYLILVGALQCILAISMDFIPPLKAFVDSFLGGSGFMGKNEGRLYGVGCALDVAGGRFAVLLIMISCLLQKVINRPHSTCIIIFLITSFFIISIIGNMIGRTTSVGMLMALLILFVNFLKNNNQERRLLKWLLPLSIAFIMIAVTLYSSDSKFRDYLRFGFEGFFSLVEQGEWDVHSNNLLADGFVFPDNIKTWIIGDGYMGDPLSNPYYIGETTYGFYMNTDMGYSRFLFYFGLIGLSLFCCFMLKLALICAERFPNYMFMFFCVLLLNYIIWVKSTTDIYLAFAMFLCISAEDELEYQLLINKTVV